MARTLLTVRAVPVLLSLVLAAGAVSVWAQPAPLQSTIAAPEATSYFGLTPQFAMSPAGQDLVFVANADGEAPALWLRSHSAAQPIRLARTENASYPFWSPDGSFVGFFASGKLMKIAVRGGSPVMVCDAPTGRGGTWNTGDEIVFASGINDPLRKVAASGGTPSPVTVVDVPRENSHRWPQFLADGRRVLFWAGGGTGSAQLKVASLDSDATVSLGLADANGAFASGYLFFKSGNALMAQRVDPGTLTKSGEPFQVVAPISTDAGSAFASFSVSPAGTLAYVRGTARPLVLTWFGRDGKPAGTLGDPGQYTNVTLSPDGTRLAVSLTAGSPANRDVWIVAVDSGRSTRVTEDPAVDATPVWSPDSARIAFSSQRAGPYQIYGTSPVAQDSDLLLKADSASIATDWSSDGRFIAYTRTGPQTALDLWILPLSGDRRPFPFLQTPAVEDNAAFSPDGRWMAYQSNESGRDEVYIRPYPPATGQLRVSRNGGTQPRWRGDGTELFFLAPDGSIMTAAIHPSPAIAAEMPTMIRPAAMTLVIRHSYTVTRDGQRFLMPVLDLRNPPVVTVVANWPSTQAR
jgi:Tol biopolymer transport system component